MAQTWAQTLEEGDPVPKLRDIYIFATPAGTPSTSNIPNTRPGNGIFLPLYLHHWGIRVGNPSDVDGGMCFELYLPEGGMKILQRSWNKRVSEEGLNSDKMLFEDTWVSTALSDEEILAAGQEVCNKELHGQYQVVEGNCQTLVNKLVERISFTTYTPRRSLSHKIGTLRRRDDGLRAFNPLQRSIAFKGEKTATNVRDKLIERDRRYADSIRAWRGHDTLEAQFIERLLASQSLEYHRMVDSLFRTALHSRHTPGSPNAFQSVYSTVAEAVVGQDYFQAGGKKESPKSDGPVSSEADFDFGATIYKVFDTVCRTLLPNRSGNETSPEPEADFNTVTQTTSEPERDSRADCDFDADMFSHVSTGVENLLQIASKVEIDSEDEAEGRPGFSNPFID